MTGLSIVDKVTIGAALLGGAAGVAGSFAVLRRRSLVGDMLAHASLPGVCIAFMITGSRNLLGLSLGACGLKKTGGPTGVPALSALGANEQTNTLIGGCSCSFAEHRRTMFANVRLFA